MSMDVYGNSPASEQGRYFRDTVWEWYPLWQYCEHLAPDLLPAGNPGYTNDGWGLDERDSLALALRLTQALDSGETKRYEESHAAGLVALPPEARNLCEMMGSTLADFSFSVENVREFAVFLRDCGGFQIF